MQYSNKNSTVDNIASGSGLNDGPWVLHLRNAVCSIKQCCCRTETIEDQIYVFLVVQSISSWPFRSAVKQVVVSVEHGVCTHREMVVVTVKHNICTQWKVIAVTVEHDIFTNRKMISVPVEHEICTRKKLNAVVAQLKRFLKVELSND